MRRLKAFNVFVFNILVLVCFSSPSLMLKSEEVLKPEQSLDKLSLEALSLQSNLSYDIVESLTTEVGPRLVGSLGDKRAVEWAVRKMKTLGFDNVHTEEVRHYTWQRGSIQAKILSPFPQNLVAIALGGSEPTPVRGVQGEVVHFESFDDLVLATEGSLEGKIAFISFRMAHLSSGGGYKAAVRSRMLGAVEAAKKGAVALLIRSIGTDSNRIAHTGSMKYQVGVPRIPAAALSNPDADLLLQQLKRDGSVSFYLNISSYRDDSKPVITANVIGEITGSTNPEQLVLLGAHLDSWDVGTGAVDDGMGVAITMAAAALIAQHEERPKRTIRLVLFAAEEVGLVGAKQYVEDHHDELEQHIIGAEWDFGTGKIHAMKSGVGEQSLAVIEELAQQLSSLGVTLIEGNDSQGQSDMSALGKKGMPTINFIPDGTDYFDVHHTNNDTLDKVDTEALKQATAVYALYAWFMAQSDVDFRQ